MIIKSQRIILPHKMILLDYQTPVFEALFKRKIKRIVDVIHRRAGKSKTALNILISASFQRVGLYFHCFPQLTQAKKAIWLGIDGDGMAYIDHYPKELVKHIDNTEMRVTMINGSIIQLVGSDMYDKLRGSNPVGIVFDEYAHSSPFCWQYTSPILRENGGWAMFIYTPNGHNHGYDLYSNNLNNPKWFVRKLDITQTRKHDGSLIITEDDIQEERDSGISEEAIQQEYYVSFEAAVIGAYYAEQLRIAERETRIRLFPIDKKLPIFTSWDLGFRDSTSIWFAQMVGRELRLIHYFEDSGRKMSDYIEYCKAFIASNGGRHGLHFAPHDIAVHEFTTGKTRLETARKMGWRFRVVGQHFVQDGIDVVREDLAYTVIHSEYAKQGLALLKMYKKGLDGKPEHGVSSHCADSLRILYMGIKGHHSEPVDNAPKQVKRNTYASSNIMTG
jgi:phage terminase large subunit